MVNGAIETVLWQGCKETVGADLLFGGILAYKTGYHGPRTWMQRNHPNDYSIQLDIDKQGPGDLGSAIDLTFKSAQAGDYTNIAKYSKRLLKAGLEQDPRAYPMREFYGNTDGDPDVEGWSYYRNRSGTSDSSHRWHIHISIHRKYINDEAAMRSILQIWNGEDDDMALSDEDITKIARRVWDIDIIPNPLGDASNPTIRAKNALVEIRNDTDEIKKQLDT